jgi:hypothetical protein
LLKLATWLRRNGHTVELLTGNVQPAATPHEVYVTSLFTYWADTVWSSVHYYKELFPGAQVTVGGIYASLAPEHCRQSGCDHVHVGVHPEAEECPPAYDLVDTDFQIMHASRGCVRRCSFCGTYKIEPRYTYKRTILPEIVRNHLVFYDNNLLANPNIGPILDELAEFRLNGRVVTSECQSGFDGRLFTAELAHRLKRARFRNPRFAWDGSYDERDEIRRQITLLEEAGYSTRDISVFMIFNFDLDPQDMIAKAEACFSWGVHVADCRYRPLDRFTDGYMPMQKTQAESEYYVHPGWTDTDVRGFRRRVRENNICLRYGIDRSTYDRRLEGLKSEDRVRLVQELGLPSERPLTTSELRIVNKAWIAASESAQVGRSGLRLVSAPPATELWRPAGADQPDSVDEFVESQLAADSTY